jgi:hypothetical protein
MQKFGLKTHEGYELENTMRGRWWVKSKVYGNSMGPFRTRKAAIDYAKAIDGEAA